MVLAISVDAMADGARRMGDVERTRFRSELLRQDISDTRPAAALRPDALGPGAGLSRARLSPEERRALREQLRQNPIPFENRGPQRPH